MTWHLKNIPKNLHLYWGRNKKLSYMRYMTAYSFSKLNPDWKINVYYPRSPCSREEWGTREQKDYSYRGDDHFGRLAEIQNVTLSEFDFESELGMDENRPEVFKSDILRWHLLSSKGGIWSDFDICYIRPINDCTINDKKLAQTEVALCYFENEPRKRRSFNTIGFLMGGDKGVSFYAGLLERAKKRYKKANDYQDLGRYLLDEYFRFSGQTKEEIFNERGIIVNNMPFSTVYPLHSRHVDKFFKVGSLKIPEHAIGLHWYAGSSITSHYENFVGRCNIRDVRQLALFKIFMEIDDKINDEREI